MSRMMSSSRSILALVHRADAHLGKGAGLFPRALGARRDRARLVAPGEEVLQLRQARLLDEPTLPRTRVSHHDVGRRVEALDEGAHLLPDVEGEGPAHALHVPRREPPLGRIEQGVRHLRVVDRVEEAEEAGVVLVDAQVLAVDGRRDAAHEPAVAPRREDRALAVLEERVLLRVQPCADVHFERRHEAGVAAKDLVTDLDEVGHVGADGVLADVDGHGVLPRESARPYHGGPRGSSMGPRAIRFSGADATRRRGARPSHASRRTKRPHFAEGTGPSTGRPPREGRRAK